MSIPKNEMINSLNTWLDKTSIKYKGYEIKNALIALKVYQYNKAKSSKINKLYDLKDILSHLKWNIKYKLLKNIDKRYKPTLEGCCRLLKLENKNLYVINFSPEDSRHFLHIAPLAEKDDNSFIFTLREDVYNYFCRKEKPVILFNVYSMWINKKKLEIKTPVLDSKKCHLLSLDIFSMIILSRAASLLDLLEMEVKKRGLPKTLITLQDSIYYDSTFASYFLGKIPTVTLQHGLITGEKEDIIWEYIISDKIIVWGESQSEVLESIGLSNDRIKVLGTAKYDVYMNKTDNEFSRNNYKRVLLGIQQNAFSPENEDKILAFIKDLISFKGDYNICIRFHPGIKRKEHSEFKQKLINEGFVNCGKIVFSDISDPIEDISVSTIILTSCSGLAIEAMLFQKPVIEYLSKKENSQKYNDYRDFSLHVSEGNEAAELIVKLIEDNRFYKKIIKIQNSFINSDIMSPPATSRIINYIDNLSNNWDNNNG